MRRIAAIVLPSLPSELAKRAQPSLSGVPLAVIIDSSKAEATSYSSAETVGDHSGAAIVGAVDEKAARLGVQAGMRVSEAMARTANISFASISYEALDEALALVAEVGLGFGPVVEVTSIDTIVIDVTGVAQLFAGESAMLREIAERVTALGFSANVAISDGPFLAQALARYSGIHADVSRIAPPGGGRIAIQQLPVTALGLGHESVTFFGRLGVLLLADLMRIDRAQLAVRLSPFAESACHSKSSAKVPIAKNQEARQREQRPSIGEVLDWLDGIDARPLVSYAPPAVLVEHMPFEDGVASAPQLLFALRGLVTRLSSRLVGRREASNRIDVSIRYDQAILRLRAGADQAPSIDLPIDLPAPLSHTDDLFRAIKAKIEALKFIAPAIGVVLRLSRVVRAPEVQLDLSRDVSVNPDALPALLSELSAEIGTLRVGVLNMVDDHRPEKRSQLVSPTQVLRREAPKARNPGLTSLDSPDENGPAEPSRLLVAPLPFGDNIHRVSHCSSLKAGTLISIGDDTFAIRSVRFDRRLDGVAWWSKVVVNRDYLRVLLSMPDSEAVADLNVAASEAWVFVDRRTGETFLHGWWE